MVTVEENDRSFESQTYSYFGFSEPEQHHVSCSIHVMSVICSVLEKSIKKNEKSFRTRRKKKDNVVTIFDGSRAPALSIRQYIERIFKYTNCSTSCLVLAYIYIERFIQQMEGVYLTSLNVHRLLITAILIAAKFLDAGDDDNIRCYNNIHYAKVGGVSTAEMNRLEMKFLLTLDFRLYVTTEHFRAQCLQLGKEGVREKNSSGTKWGPKLPF